MTTMFNHQGILRLDAWVGRPWLVHGFSTRLTGDFRGLVATESARLLGLDGLLVTVKQMHTARVLRADGQISGLEPRLEGDALLSATAGETVGIRVADCLPLLLLDPARRAVAAVHAGWRGSAAGIAALAVESMRKEYGSHPRDLEAVIGPCISGPCYEVGEEVASRFGAAAVLRNPGWPRPHVDLAAANRLQLEAAGLVAKNIHGGIHCTFSEAGLFHSHRRDGDSAGRMLAFIGLR